MRIRRTIGILAAAVGISLAGVAAASPALAVTNETGHVQSLAVPSSVDWSIRITWASTYNTVGTSSTQPSIVEMKKNSSIGIAKKPKSMQLLFAKGPNGPNVWGVTENVVNGCATDTLFTLCTTYGNKTDIKFTDKPWVIVTFWTGANKTGEQIGPFAYLYK